uniref:N/A n=1 Tax=Ganoderma boninense TaxID=34458 RepID=A0A5K1JXY1_9APHY|nr:N/A [Ganoderma boninense]
MLARQLVRAGCAQDKVGLVLQTVSRALGHPISERMSAHTVRQAVLEAGIASDIQIGHSIRRGKAFTGSGDATTDRHINYEARHVLVTEPTEDGRGRTYKNFLVGVDSTPDHTSERQVHDWIEKFSHIVKTHNESPLSYLTEGDELNLEMCALKLKGMGGDHAADQIKTARGVAAWKKKMTCFVLGRDHVRGGLGAGTPGLSQANSEGDSAATSPVVELLNAEATASAIEAVGLASWETLSPEARVALFALHLKQATIHLGESLYDALPEVERRPLDVFLRLGCAMHKDLNAVKGGNAEMMAAWAELPDVIPPILLANKDNTSTLRDVNPELLVTMVNGSAAAEDLSPAELRAFESSTRGGVKLTNLAGSAFNNKDDKLGQHDTYVYYFAEKVPHLPRRRRRFPDTNNTRYQSHCTAAAELLAHHQDYVHFLELIRDRKVKPGFTNLEENVWKGLHDPATLTELAALTLYAQAVTHPYMRVARQPQNGLKLGPLHDQLKGYIQQLIDDPDALLHPDTTLSQDGPTAAMDGQQWEHPDAVTAVYQMLPKLPHLKFIFVRFLQGALKTWERFTREFEKGGAIDQASAGELEDICILPTNCQNEGILGLFRQWKRANPNGTLAYFNALAKSYINGTEDFIATYLDDEASQRHLRSAARDLDRSGHESERRKFLTDQAIEVAERNAREYAEKQKRVEEEMAVLRGRKLVLDREVVVRMTRDQMEEQLEVYRKVYRDPPALVPLKSHIPNRPDKLAVLLAAIERHSPRNSVDP